MPHSTKQPSWRQSESAAHFFHIDDAAILRVFTSRVDTLSHVDPIHNIVPGRIIGQRINQSMRLAANVIRSIKSARAWLVALIGIEIGETDYLYSI